jgi:hypothetical protein
MLTPSAGASECLYLPCWVSADAYLFALPAGVTECVALQFQANSLAAKDLAKELTL